MPTVTDCGQPTTIELLPTPFGRLFRPPGVTDQGVRADWRNAPYEQGIASHGYRLVWTRRTECPCPPVDVHLTQADPSCPMCEGTGSYYFGDSTPQDLTGEVFSPVQQEILRRSGGFLIRGIISGISTTDVRNDQMGSWMRGGTQVTTAPENRLTFRDRLVNIDVVMPYTQVVVRPSDQGACLPLRYLVSGGIYLVLDQDGVRYAYGTDYVDQAGKIFFVPGRGPQSGKRVSCHYLTFPVWMVEDALHRDRVQNVKNNPDTTGPLVSSEGRLQRLPTQARLSLEFIPSVVNDPAYAG